MEFKRLTTSVIIGVGLLISGFFTDAFSAGAYRHTESGNNLGFKGIGPRIGFVDPQGALDGTAEVGVVFDFGELAPRLKLDGSASFWSTGRNYRYYNGNHYEGYDWTVRDLILRAGVNYRFLEGEWIPYAGGGIGMHFYSWDYNGAPYYSNNSDTQFGIYLDGGIEHQLSDSWTGQVQLQTDFVALDQTALLFNFIYRLQ